MHALGIRVTAAALLATVVAGPVRAQEAPECGSSMVQAELLAGFNSPEDGSRPQARMREVASVRQLDYRTTQGHYADARYCAATAELETGEEFEIHYVIKARSEVLRGHVVTACYGRYDRESRDCRYVMPRP